MAGRINDEDIQALRERADIATVIGDYTALRRAGATLKGLCPFHAEKTPSFTVDPARNLFHCFGCSEGGDVYRFLERIEALSFPEAVERLARIVGYELRYAELSPGQRRALGRRTRLAQAVAHAAEYYVEQLAGDDGAAARDYLAGRGMREPDIERFRLGWAPDRWDDLVRRLSGAGFSTEEIADAGLASRGARGLIDRFRGRVVFPILDAGGRDVVAFGGRVLPGATARTWPDGTPPKYINSPETPVYRKSETLYALNWARAEVQRRDSALVVEGYMDVIALHIAGVRNAVATCGTALTVEHLRALERFARRVVLALDADDAGFAAADRARALAEEVGIREVGVLPLPPGQDPADLAAGGAERVEDALRDVRTAVEFQIEHLLRGADVSTPEGQVDAYRRTFPLLARLPDRVLRYRYVRDLVAPAVRLSADLVERELDAAVAGGGEPAPATPRPSSRSTLAPVPGPGDVAAPTRDPQLALEGDVLRIALQAPHLLPAQWKQLTAEDFRAPLSRQLFAALAARPAGDVDGVLAELPDDAVRSRVRALALSDAKESEPSHAARKVAALRAAAVERRRVEAKERLARLNAESDPVEYRTVFTSIIQLERQKRDLLEGRDA